MTVYNKLKSILPDENFVYFGDLKNSPYGQKTKEQLIDITSDIFEFFKYKKAKAVVMACNTTSANVYDVYKDKYDYTIYPIIQSCAKIISKMNVKTLGVFATSATVSTNTYTREIQKHNPDIEVFEMSCPGWVQIVENGKQDDELSIELVKENLDRMMKNQPDKIVLGCTHYPFLLNILSKFVNREIFIDPALHFASFIKQDLEKQNLLNNNGGNEEFYVSANAEEFKNAAKMFYELQSPPEIINFATV